MRFTLFFSIDSFVGAFLMLACSRRRLDFRLVAGMFALCDGLAAVLGTLWRAGHTSSAWMSDELPIMLSVALMLLVFSAKRDDRGLWCLPVLLSVDNFIGGLNGAFLPVATAFMSAISSGVFAVLGMLAAHQLDERLPRVRRIVARFAPFFVCIIPSL